MTPFAREIAERRLWGIDRSARYEDLPRAARIAINLARRDLALRYLERDEKMSEIQRELIEMPAGSFHQLAGALVYRTLTADRWDISRDDGSQQTFDLPGAVKELSQ